MDQAVSILGGGTDQTIETQRSTMGHGIPNQQVQREKIEPSMDHGQGGVDLSMGFDRITQINSTTLSDQFIHEECGGHVAESVRRIK